ncbi:cytochrome c oxidase subunit II [Novosphingobium cyanobacteriorum]|uniref:Cytochrome c oxidase subunit 2 n=1 Tax=Novosphingobium cyanobacteriorum TaxID=3024215 RepID=A0ABT6CHI6_9SPHN|nr:cytochrome c oxidase subunit II [Novosphingobium cyanobacteriorum]MDF8332520.1 cytochrome c oxidase subunit II [Novosphingobium cyanobacteriorum]
MGKAIRTVGLAAALAIAPQAAMAAPAAAPAAEAAAPVAAAAAPAAEAAAAPAADKYVPMKPVAGKGQPVEGRIGFQDQYSPTGKEALVMHDYVLMPIITVISLFVLFLLLVVMARFNRRANPVASKTSHNTLIEVVWTLVPVLILVVIAVPSIRLIAHQYKPAPKGALTVKVTGYQWYWGYSYPDNGGFEVISNMLPDEEALKRGEQPQLGADARMVVPAGEDIRIQTTGADVIHAFAVPSLWFKLDAVPGRINEKVIHIDEPGVYYGQCSELCGVRHGYMPIVVEALPRPKFEAWVKEQGGTVGGAAAAAPAAVTPAAAAAPAPAPAADASAAPAA